MDLIPKQVIWVMIYQEMDTSELEDLHWDLRPLLLSYSA